MGALCLALHHVSMVGYNFLEAHAGIRGAELPVKARLGGMAGLRPRGRLRVDPRPTRSQGLARQDAPCRFGPVEPAAMPGRKRPTPRFVGRERVMERGVGMGVQRVAAPRQILGLTVARMANFRLNAAWPAPRRSAPVRRSGPAWGPRRLRTGGVLANMLHA